MRDRVQPGRCDKRLRYGQGQIDIVDHRFRQGLRVGLRRLQAVARLAEDGGHLRAGIACRHHDLRQIGSQRNRLAEPGCRSAPDGDNTVYRQFPDASHRALGHVDRRMHLGLRKDCGRAIAKHCGDA